MMLPRKLALLLAAAALGGCSISSLLGGGSKVPPTLQTLTAEAPDPGSVVRNAAAGQAVTVLTPIIGNALNTLRVPVQVSPTDVQYVTGLQWVDTPDKLFQDLLEETVRRTTNRVVIDPNQTGLDPGVVLHGELEKFGYDAQTGQVMVAARCPARTEPRFRPAASSPPRRRTAPGLPSALRSITPQTKSRSKSRSGSAASRQLLLAA